MTSSVESKPLLGKKIMIVEDNFLIAADLCDVVRGAGGVVNNVYSSEGDALAAVANEEIDGALLNVQLGKETSVEVARQLDSRHVPYIVVTGYPRETLEQELQHVPYVSKPFDREKLIAVGERHFTVD